MEDKSFEQSMIRLDEIVKSLEQGDVTLADSMRLFEEGTALVRSCTSMLDAAEQQVVRISRNAEDIPEETPFPVNTETV